MSLVEACHWVCMPIDWNNFDNNCLMLFIQLHVFDAWWFIDCKDRIMKDYSYPSTYVPILLDKIWSTLTSMEGTTGILSSKYLAHISSSAQFCLINKALSKLSQEMGSNFCNNMPQSYDTIGHNTQDKELRTYIFYAL